MVAVFVDLIKRGIYTIDQVPTPWRAGVQEALGDNHEDTSD